MAEFNLSAAGRFSDISDGSPLARSLGPRVVRESMGNAIPDAPLSESRNERACGAAESVKSPGENDVQLMRRVRDGDVQAFEKIVERFWHGTLLYASQLVGDSDVADDVAQEAFARLWQGRAEWSGTGSVRFWLLRTSRNLVISEQRKREVRASWWSRHARTERPGRPPTPLQEAETSELRDAIRAAVKELSPRRREAFTLYHLQGLSYQEVADIMEVRPQTVANYLQAALTNLRDALRPHFVSFNRAEELRMDERARTDE